MEEEKANANSELRFIALELSKIAFRKNKPFAQVASEYVQNVHELESILRSSCAKKSPLAQKRRQRA